MYRFVPRVVLGVVAVCLLASPCIIAQGPASAGFHLDIIADQTSTHAGLHTFGQNQYDPNSLLASHTSKNTGTRCVASQDMAFNRFVIMPGSIVNICVAVSIERCRSSSFAGVRSTMTNMSFTGSGKGQAFALHSTSAPQASICFPIRAKFGPVLPSSLANS